LPSWFSWFSM